AEALLDIRETLLERCAAGHLGEDHLDERAVRQLGDFLREIADSRAARELDLAAIGAQRAGEDLEQRGFAGSVWADEPDLVVGAQCEAGALEERARPEAEREVLGGEEAHRRVVYQTGGSGAGS